QAIESNAKQIYDLKDLIGNVANDPSSFDFNSVMNEFQKFSKSQKDEEKEIKNDTEIKTATKPTKKT
ncbi:hypothetical protein DTQ32_01645, partial [Ureaplasma parvum]